MSTALATTNQNAMAKSAPGAIGWGPAGMQIRSLADALTVADYILKSGIAPPSLKSAEAVLICLQSGAEIGLTPMQSMKSIYVVNNRPTPYGDAVPAQLFKSGMIAEFDEWYEANGVRLSAEQEGKGIGDNWCAACLFRRKDIATPIIRRFSVADAKKSGLYGKAGPWKDYPARMLRMRARAFAARDGAADILCGLSIVEEQNDIPIAPSLRNTGTPLPRGYWDADKMGDRAQCERLLGGPNRAPMKVGDDWFIGEEIHAEISAPAATQTIPGPASPAPAQNRIDRVRTNFEAKSVSLAQLEAHVGRTSDEWTEDDFAAVTKLWAEVRSGATKPEAVGAKVTDAELPSEPEAAPDLGEIRGRIQDLAMSMAESEGNKIFRAHGLMDGIESLAKVDSLDLLSAVESAFNKALSANQ